MLQITPEEELQKYWQTDAYSQSQLKGKFSGKQTRAMIIGSAIDHVLFSENQDLEEKFKVSPIGNLSDTERLVLNHVVEGMINDSTIEIHDRKYMTLIENKIDEIKWQSNWKQATRIAKMKNIIREFPQIVLADREKGITYITEKEKILIPKMVDLLRNNDSIKSFIFDREGLANNNKIKVIYQYPVYFTIKLSGKVYNCKALLDAAIFIYDKFNNLKEIEIIDLKYTEQSLYIATKQEETVAMNMMRIVNSLRYDIQAAWYSQAIYSTTKEDIPYPTFTLLVASEPDNNVYSFRVSKNLLKRGTMGDRYYKGYVDLLTRYNTNYNFKSNTNDFILDYDV